MKKNIICLILLVVLFFCSFVVVANAKTVHSLKIKSTAVPADSLTLRNGDIVFQSSKSGQSLAVQLATKSPYSHCGIVFIEKGKYYVYEAVQPVRKTPLDEWAAHGDDGKYVVKRLKEADKYLTDASVLEMKRQIKGMLGKSYDLAFEWSDDRIYCSEFVWKLYKRACDLEVGELQCLGDFDLSHPAVQRIVKERYGENIPMEETVVSPAAIFASNLLITVGEQDK
ncbi:MAG: YiiX family permuted papain-like enzyme [Bacteroidota bacterium]